jgi:tetratricopeptide (TPR) repeat protein
LKRELALARVVSAALLFRPEPAFADATASFDDTTATAPVPASHPSDGAALLFERAQRFEASGRISEAIGAYTESLRLDPTRGPALLALGRLRARIGDAGEAERLFSMAAREPDVESEALTERARLRRSQGRNAEALADLENASTHAAKPDSDAELAAWYAERRAWLAALSEWRRVAAEATSDDIAARAKLEVRALTVLAAELDPVAAGAAKNATWTRRMLYRLADSKPEDAPTKKSRSTAKRR